MSCGMQAYNPVSDYREFPPPLPLAGHLLCLWTQVIADSRSDYAQRVLPDGCIDIVLINDETPSVLRAIWRGAVRARFERIANVRGVAARKSAMESALIDHLAQAEPVDDAMKAAIQWLARHPHGRVEQLSRWIGFSSRQLQRRFTTAVGYGPKMFQSVLRFQRLLNLSGGTHARWNLAQFSADAGYADQAHMTREVQRFSGSAPSVLLRSARSALRLSDLLETAHEEIS